MKTIKNLFTIALLAGCSISWASGVRGGGETINISGYPELLELVRTKKFTCEWTNGKDFSQRENIKTAYDGVFTKLVSIDPVFAEDLKGEINYLQFCLTGALKSYPSYGEMLSPIYKNADQVAIRLNQEVYANNEILKEMSSRSQVYLLIHEAMHSYLSYHTTARQLKLRTAVSIIEAVELGQIKDKLDLHTQLEKNGVQFPFSSFLEDEESEFVRFLSLQGMDKFKLLLKRTNLTKFFMITPETLKKLGPYAKSAEPWVSAPYETLVSSICAVPGLDAKYLNHVIEDAKIYPYSASQLPLVCLSAAGTSSSMFWRAFAWLESTGGVTHHLNAFYNRVMTRGFEIRSNRLTANKEFNRFLGSYLITQKPIPYLSLDQPDRSLEFSSLAVLYAHYAKKKDTAEINKLFWNNSLFQQVVSIQDLKDKATSSNPYIVREAGHSLLQNPLLFTQIMTDFAIQLEKLSDQKVAQDFVEKLMSLRPGYYVNKNFIPSTKETGAF
ncbi:MAG: hypothetical protein AB7F59_06740 [Bdellovibrionales bacterium]